MIFRHLWKIYMQILLREWDLNASQIEKSHMVVVYRKLELRL